LAIRPPATRERATESIEQAKDALATVHAGRGALAERINESFDLAARLGIATCAAALLLAALVALVVSRDAGRRADLARNWLTAPPSPAFSAPRSSMMMALAGTMASGSAAPSTSQRADHERRRPYVANQAQRAGGDRHGDEADQNHATCPKARTIGCVSGAVIRLPKPIGASNSPQTRTERSRTYCRYCGNKNSTPTKATQMATAQCSSR
jgi:hypothetical protein